MRRNAVAQQSPLIGVNREVHRKHQIHLITTLLSLLHDQSQQEKRNPGLIEYLYQN